MRRQEGKTNAELFNNKRILQVLYRRDNGLVSTPYYHAGRQLVKLVSSHDWYDDYCETSASHGYDVQNASSMLKLAQYKSSQHSSLYLFTYFKVGLVLLANDSRKYEPMSVTYSVVSHNNLITVSF